MKKDILLLGIEFIKKILLEKINIIWIISLLFRYITTSAYFLFNYKEFIIANIEDIISVSIVYFIFIIFYSIVFYLWTSLRITNRYFTFIYGERSRKKVERIFFLSKLFYSFFLSISFLMIFLSFLKLNSRLSFYLYIILYIIYLILIILGLGVLRKKYTLDIIKIKEGSNLIAYWGLGLFLYLIILGILFLSFPNILTKKDINIYSGTGGVINGEIIYLQNDKVWVNTHKDGIKEYFLTNKIKEEINKRRSYLNNN